MCYEERLFNSQATKTAQKRERDTAIEGARPVETPIRPAPPAKTTHRKETERELKEIA